MTDTKREGTSGNEVPMEERRFMLGTESGNRG